MLRHSDGTVVLHLKATTKSIVLRPVPNAQDTYILYWEDGRRDRMPYRMNSSSLPDPIKTQPTKCCVLPMRCQPHPYPGRAVVRRPGDSGQCAQNIHGAAPAIICQDVVIGCPPLSPDGSQTAPMSRSQRLLDLIQILRPHRRPVSGATLADETGISLRTLYRDTRR